VLSIIGILLIAILIILPVSAAKDKIAERKRAKIISEFRGTIKINYDEKDEYLLNMYKEHDAKWIESVYNLISDQSSLDSSWKKYDKKIKASDKTDKKHDEYRMRELEFMGFVSPHLLIKQLQDNEIITKQDKHCVADKHTLETLTHFIKYLKSRNLLTDLKLEEKDEELDN
jgi:hypothetical protein